MDICVASGAKGGTGKTTFSFILGHILNYLYKDNIILINLSKIPYNIKTDLYISTDISEGGSLRVLDFPAFQMSDRYLLSLYLSCKNVVFVVDEDPYTAEIAEAFLRLLNNKNIAIIINMIIGKPSIKYLIKYRKISNIYLVPYDENIRIYRTEGLDPIRVRSPGVAKMIRAAVDIARRLNSS